MEGEGLKKYLLIVLFTTCASIYAENGLNIPDDWKQFLVTLVASSVMTYTYLFIRARFKFETDLLSVVGSALFMATIGGTLIGLTDNLLNGERSFGVALKETLASHKWQLGLLVIGTMLLSKKARKAMSGFMPDFEFYDE